MLRDLGWLKKVKLRNIANEDINPATNEKLDELKAALQSIYDAVDDLELTSENIRIEAGQINLNTDDLETKVQSVRDQLNVLLDTRASESTLLDVKTVLDNVKTVLDSIDGAVATEATLLQIRDYVDSVETKLQIIIDTLNVDLSTRASEATLTEVRDTIGQSSGITVLSRLLDLWSKLVELFNNGVAKLKIWDGTNQVNITSDNKLQTVTHGRGVCSIFNSTQELLGNGDYFQGTWESILDYSMIIVNVFADADSAVDGLLIEWSCDGVHVNQTDTFTIYANLGKTFSFGAITTYYRIRYTNGTNPQTLFRLQTLLKNFNQKASSHRITDPIVGEDDAQLVKSVLTGRNSGNFINVKVDEYGRLQTVSPTAAALANIPIQICVQKDLIAVNNYEWQEVLSYTVPTGYDFNAIAFCALSSVANEAAQAIYRLNLGSFVGSTNTFTNGESWELPKFASKMFVYVTSAIGSGGNDVITITYTNQDGITGRTGTVTIPKNSVVGTRLEVTLQGEDYGITDVTNVTHSQTGQTGNFNIEGNLALFGLILTSANVAYHSPTPPLNAIVVPAGGTIHLMYEANSAVINARWINLQGSLAPRG